MYIFKETIFHHIINIFKFVIKSIKINLINVMFSYFHNKNEKFLHHILKRLAARIRYKLVQQAETCMWHGM